MSITCNTLRFTYSELNLIYKITNLKTFYRSNKQSEPDLYALISQRRDERKDQFNSMFSSLVSKYGGDGASSEPNEQEFEAAQKKLESRRLSQKSKRKS